MTERRTIRRYAHELYPGPREGKVQPLAEAVPYLYARMIGLNVWGTSWFDLDPRETREAVDRTSLFVTARTAALHADALLQGMGGAEAWEWAESRARDESGEVAYERAARYGVNPDAIKPYPCGPEPTRHEHPGERRPYGRVMVPVDGRESDCDQCTEPVPEGESA